MDKVNLKEFAAGTLQEKFDKSFERVIENLQDPNTPFKNKRQINIKFVFEQNEERDDVRCSIDIKETLAPQNGISTMFSMGKDLRAGEVYAEEYGKQIKGQQVFSEVRENKGVGEIPVDPYTGEVIESQIIDFRKAN